ncbi:MAG: PDZ domain-containing protein [Gemmatimonadaceae bacterium]|nr:PDZ domain-containing protein [Gemmatimonadaceae bacterium]
MKRIQLFLAAVSLVSATGLSAQTKPRPEPRVSLPAREGCVTKDGNTECRNWHFKEDSSAIKRAVIGVEVQTTGTKRDTLGVFIARVTPDGPAEKAGIVEGDRIASINGVDLRVPAVDVEDSYTAGLAAHRLTREMQKLTPGAQVSLRVTSGGRIRDVQVTSIRASELMKLSGEFGLSFPRTPLMQVMPAMPGMPPMPAMPSMPAMPNVRIYRENLEGLMEVAPAVRVRARTLAPLAAPARLSGKFRTSI